MKLSGASPEQQPPVTDRRDRAEGRLPDCEVFRRAFEDALLGMCLVDVSSRILRVNRAFCDLLGSSREELEGQPVAERVHPEDLGEGLVRARGLCDGQVQSLQLEGRLIRGDGETLRVRVTASAVRDAECRLSYGLGIVCKVFESGGDEGVVRERESRYRSIVEDQTEFIVRWLPDGVRTFVNESYCRYFGGTRRELIGTSFFPLIAEEDRERVRRKIESLTPENPVATAEHQVLRPDGGIGWQQWTDRAIFDSGGRLIEYQSVGRDVTELRRLQEIAEHQREELARADKMITLGTLVSGVAHEINNPNHFIMLNLPFLREVWKDARPLLDLHFERHPELHLARIPYDEVRDDVAELIEEIYQGADRIRDIVSELRDYAQRPIEESRQAVAVNEVVTTALTLIANPIKKATRRFSTEYGDDLPAVGGNFRRLEQVVINLILNACQALSEAGQAVRVRTGYDAGTDHVVITVEDEGSGIPEEELGSLTDPFFTTKQESGGTGLGLSVAARIVQEHQGELTFVSEVGRGTSARVSLPVYRETTDEEGDRRRP